MSNLRSANITYASGDSNDTTPCSPTQAGMMSQSTGDHGGRPSLRHELQGDLCRAETGDGGRVVRGGRKRGVDAETAEKESSTDTIDVKHMSAGTCK